MGHTVLGVDEPSSSLANLVTRAQLREQADKVKNLFDRDARGEPVAAILAQEYEILGQMRTRFVRETGAKDLAALMVTLEVPEI